MTKLTKKGLRRFTIDVDMFHDLRIRKLVCRKGGQAIAVYTLLLVYIYKDGYYAEVDEDLVFYIAEQLNFEEQYVNEVIESCVNLGIFDKAIYDSYKVLTSAETQAQFVKAKKKSKENKVTDFSLSDAEKPMAEPIKLEAAIEQMWTDREWVKSTCISHKLSAGELSGKFDRFALFCRKNGEPSSSLRTLDDYKVHFNAWLRKNLLEASAACRSRGYSLQPTLECMAGETLPSQHQNPQKVAVIV